MPLTQFEWPVMIAAVLEKKRKDYAFWRQFNEKPSVIPGCPDLLFYMSASVESAEATASDTT